MNYLIIIITSAVTGALVTSIMTIVGQWRERRARQKELIFTKAFDLARRRNENVFATSRETSRSAAIVDEMVMAKDYYDAAKKLFDAGELTDKFKDDEGKSSNVL